MDEEGVEKKNKEAKGLGIYMFEGYWWVDVPTSQFRFYQLFSLDFDSVNNNM